MTHPHSSAHSHRQKARDLVRRSGYAQGGRPIGAAEAVHAHERHDHPGEPLTKLKTGGSVDDMDSAPRLDHAKRGGRHKKHGKTQVNVIVSPQGGEKPVPVPVPVGGGAPMPPAGPMAGPPPGAVPPMPPQGPGGMKKGGAVKMDAGSGGGEGRREKIEAYGIKSKAPMKKGGRC